MASSSDPKLDAFLAAVGELETLAARLSETWDELEAKAKSMAPKYSHGADGFMALPRLWHEVGELLDGLAMDIVGDELGACEFSREMLRADMQDLVDVVKVAQMPRKEATVNA